MAATLEVYVFRSGAFGRDAQVCVVRKNELMSRDDIDRTFFGYVAYGGDTFTGVWGTRNASKLRRLLREKGAELIIDQTPPPVPRTSWVTYGKARADAAKENLL